MTMLLYSALLTLGLILSAPWWLLRMATTERYREGLRQRLGFVPAALKATIAGKRTVWLHAVSVGEVLAATRLVAELETALGEGWSVVISTTTRTGQALAKQRFGEARVFYMPLDFAFAVRAYLRALNPAALILMESELWPRLLHECSTCNIPVAVANARVSDRSFRRAMRVRPLWKHLIRKPTLWLAQSDEDARRLRTLGARPETVQATGNLKYDIRTPKQSWAADLIVKAANGRPIIVAGSTVGAERFDEERMVLAAWRFTLQQGWKSLLVLAPRHPERFENVKSYANEFWSLAVSDLQLGGRCIDPFADDPLGEERPEVEVVVLDTIGDLASVYGVATVAYVGGTLVQRGGHNPLEPAQFGVPVVMGPSFENFRDIVAKMQAVDGIRIVQDDVALEEVLVELLSNIDAARAMGQRGRAVFESQQGATARTVEAILNIIPGARP